MPAAATDIHAVAGRGVNGRLSDSDVLLGPAAIRLSTPGVPYSTVTDLAKLRGLSTSVPRTNATW